MTIKYLKIWISVIKESLDFKKLSMVTILYIVLFFTLLLIFKMTTLLSLFLILLIIIVRQTTRLFMFYRKLIEDNKYDLVLLKPIDPLIGLLIYNKDPMDVFLVLPILIFIKFKKNR